MTRSSDVTPCWPADLPQKLDRRNFRETLPDGVLRSNVDGPEKRRRRATAAPSTIAGQMLLTGYEWKRLRLFFDVDLQSGALSFDFPDPDRDDGATDTIRVSFAQPPSRTNPGGDNWWARLQFRVQPGIMPYVDSEPAGV